MSEDFNAAIPPRELWLPDANGKLHAVPYNASLESYLRFLSETLAPPTELTAAASVSSLELTGVAREEDLLLTAKLQIQTHQAGFSGLALNFNEAILRETAYRGDGDAWFTGRDRDRGYRWGFRGKGQHELTLVMSVPIKKQFPARRVQLLLPTTPVSRLRINVPMANLLVKAGDANKPAEQPYVQTTSLDDGQTELELVGLGARLDFSWQPRRSDEQQTAVLDTTTRIIARVSADSVYLTATQDILSLQGPFDHFHLKLPTNAELQQVEGKDYRDHQYIAQPGGEVRINLAAMTTGPIKLQYTLRQQLADRRQLILDGLSVREARKQTGEIGLTTLEGLRLASREDPESQLIRINAGELRPTEGVARAYRFLNQPFQLRLNIEAVEPYFTIDPSVFLMAAAEQWDLDAIFHGEVYRGGVSGVTLQWPNWKEDGWLIDSIRGWKIDNATGWTVDPGTANTLVERFQPENDAAGTLHIPLVEPRAGRFKLQLRARRTKGLTGDAHLTLPRALGSSVARTTLVIADAENITSELFPRGETVFRPLSVQMRERLEFPVDWRDRQDLRRAEYRLDTDEASLALRMEKQARKIRLETEARLALVGERLQVRQSLIYHVDFQRLGTVRLIIPEALRDGGVRFYAEDDTELVPRLVLADGQELTELEIEKPRLGRLEIQARYSLPAPDITLSGGETTVTVPFARAAEAPFTSSLLRWQPHDWAHAVVIDKPWRAHGLQPESPTWINTNGATDCTVKLAPSSAGYTGTGTISRIWLRSRVAKTGEADHWGLIRVEGAGRFLAISLPVELLATRKPRFFWNDEELRTRIELPPAGSRNFQFRLPDDASRDGWLAFEFASSHPRFTGLGSPVRLPVPHFPQPLGVAQIIWQVELPSDQHLLTMPETASALFTWQRSGWFWRRIPTAPTSELQRWMNGGRETPLGLAPEQGNQYTFSQLGEPRPLEFRTISSPMLLLLGAGLSLVLGYGLIRFPKSRQSMTLAAGALVLAVAALWSLEPVILLLQPMLLGSLFPLCAVLIEFWQQRRRVDLAVLGDEADRGQTSGLSITSVSHAMIAPIAPSSERRDVGQSRSSHGSRVEEPPPTIMLPYPENAGADDPTYYHPPRASASDSQAAEASHPRS